ncbi:MAG TPA: hypothetical protein VFY22_03970, partial [Hydrogenophaga sp.]|nr:hypothetical protein [Hydrogenophaga sp.]
FFLDLLILVLFSQDGGGAQWLASRFSQAAAAPRGLEFFNGSPFDTRHSEQKAVESRTTVDVAGETK